MRRIGVVALMVVMVLGLGAFESSASRKPKSPEREKIERALRGKFDCSLVAGKCTRKIRVSTKRQTWAAAYIKGSKTVQGDVASLKKKKGRWRIHQIGNGGGCDVPKKVVKDLNLACY